MQSRILRATQKLLQQVKQCAIGHRDRPVERICTEFAEVFPGRCLVCSYHRFGLQEGLTKDPKPPAHYCCESQEAEGDNEDKCAFCGGEDIRSGSWAPETCLDCGAVWYMGVWFKKSIKEDQNAEIDS